MRCVTSSPTRGYIGVTRAFRHQHGSVDLARICTGTLSSGEAIAKCTGCRKYVNTATSPDCRSDRLPLGKCHNLLEYGIPMELQQQAQHWWSGPGYAVSLMFRHRLEALVLKPAGIRLEARERVRVACAPGQATHWSMKTCYYVASDPPHAQHLVVALVDAMGAALHQCPFRSRHLGRQGSCEIRSTNDRYILCKRRAYMAGFCSHR